MNEVIDAHLRHLKAAGLAPDTTVFKRGRLLHRLDEQLPMGLERATVEELEAFLATPGFSLETQANYYGHLVGFFRWATHPSRLHLDYDPSAGLRRPKVPEGVPHPITNAELAHALANLRGLERTYALLAAYEGMRAGEIATIERRTITKERTRIFGKGSKVRSLRTHHAVWEAVEPLPEGRIAHRVRTGRHADANYISGRMLYLFRRIDLPDVTIHRLRHWYGTMMLRSEKYGGAGASLRTVQENMGHASPTTTARYTLVCDEERDAAIDALPTFGTSAPC